VRNGFNIKPPVHPTFMPVVLLIFKPDNVTEFIACISSDGQVKLFEAVKFSATCVEQWFMFRGF